MEIAWEDILEKCALNDDSNTDMSTDTLDSGRADGEGRESGESPSETDLWDWGTLPKSPFREVPMNSFRKVRHWREFNPHNAEEIWDGPRDCYEKGHAISNQLRP